MLTIGSHIPVNLTTPAYAGVPSHIPVNLTGIADVLCNGKWRKVDHDKVNFTHTEQWSPVNYDAVSFDFTCTYNCNNLWQEWVGSQLPIDFLKKWKDVNGNIVAIDFSCEEGGSTGGGTLFTGVFDYSTGETLSFDFQPSWNVNLFDGAYAVVDTLTIPEHFLSVATFDGASLDFDFDTDWLIKTYEGGGLDVSLSAVHGFGFDFFSGAGIYDTGGCQPISGLVNLGSSGNATPDPTANSVRLQNNGSSSRGSAVGFGPVDLTEKERLVITWSQTLNGPWYDNDNTDAKVIFGFLLDRTPSQATTLVGVWEYNSPFSGYSDINRPWINIWLPRDSDAKTITVQARQAVGYAANMPPFVKPAGIDFYKPGSELTVVLTKVSGKVHFEFYHSDLEEPLQSGLIDLPWPGIITPAWHYCNYSHGSSYVDISNIRLCEEEFLTTYPSSDFFIDVDFPVGETLGATLSTEVTLSAEFGHGDLLASSLETRPSINIEPRAYEGATAGADLTTSASFQTPFYDGAAGTIDILINPATNPQFAFYDGGTLSFSLSTALQFGSTPAYEGARVDISLDSVEFWTFVDGASVEADLATETTIQPEGFGGETLAVVLEVRSSEGMGTFRGYEGASGSVSFTTLPQVLLYPNEIKVNIEFNYDILGFGGIDLLNTACCPVKDDHARVELTDGPAPDERYDGDKVLFTVELSALPRFVMNAYEGAVFGSEDPEYLSFNFFDGTSASIPQVHLDYYNFNLCVGNFLPDGDHINVELVATDSLCNDADLMFEGATMTMELEANPNFQLRMYDGGVMDFNFTFIAAWAFQFYAGEFLRVSNPEFTPRFYEGAMVTFTFEEKDWVGYSGEFVEIKLSTDYEVEFLEQGCLDNEFVPTNENGDADWDKFNPVPVELEFFSHSIKARCF